MRNSAPDPPTMPTCSESLPSLLSILGSLVSASVVAFLVRTYLGQWELVVFIASVLLAAGGIMTDGWALTHVHAPVPPWWFALALTVVCLIMGSLLLSMFTLSDVLSQSITPGVAQLLAPCPAGLLLAAFYWFVYTAMRKSQRSINSADEPERPHDASSDTR